MCARPDAEPLAELRADRCLRPRCVLGDARLSQAHMVGQLAVSRDGRWAVTDTGGRNDEVVYVWDLVSGELCWSTDGRGQDQFALHPDGEHVAIYDREERALRLCSLATGRSESSVRLEGFDERSVSQLRVSSDGVRLLVGHRDVFDFRTGARIAHIADFEQSYFPAYLSPRGNVVVTSKSNNTLWCHDLRTGRSTLVEDLGEQPYGYAMTADERTLVVRGFGAGVVYSLTEPIAHLDADHCALCMGDGSSPNALAISHDGARVAVSCDASRIEIVRLPELATMCSLPIDRVHALAFHPDGEHIVVARYGDIVNYYDSASLEVWNIASGNRVDPPGLRGHRAGVLAMAVAPGLVCSTGVDNTVRLWSVPECGEVERFDTGVGRAAHVDVDLGFERILVVDSSDMSLYAVLFDAKRLVEHRRLDHRGEAAMSPDGRHIAQLALVAGMGWRPLIIVDVATGAEVVRFPGTEDHNEVPFAVAWGPDSAHVITYGRHAFSIYDLEREIVEHQSEESIYDAVLLAGGSHAWVDETGLHVATKDAPRRSLEGTFYDDYSHHAIIAPSHDGAAIAVTDGKHIWCFDAATLEERGAVEWVQPPRYRLLSLAYSHDDRQLFAGTSLGPILCFDVVG